MLCSVIIPVFNCKAYLTACVESVREAGIESYEILLIDDGSTDGSGALCDMLAAQFPEVRVVHQPNGGVSSARNRGILEAGGACIVFIDSDDTVKPEPLGQLLEAFRDSKADLAIFGMSVNYYKNGQCYRRDELFHPHQGLFSKEQWAAHFLELFSANAISSSCTKIFRREILTKNQIFFSEDMFLYEDLEFVLRYLRHCNTIYNAPDAIYGYRQSEDEGNAGRRLARIDSISDFIKPIEASLAGLDQVPPQQRAEVLTRLYRVLAREKISVSDLRGIRRICGDYAKWYSGHGFSGDSDVFHQWLLSGRAGRLLWHDIITALRHKIAVWAKAHHLYR